MGVRNKVSAVLIPTLLAMTVAGCASSPAPEAGLAASQVDASLGQANYTVARPSTYLLRSSDLISVAVFREPDLSLPTVRIGVEGNVSVPMLGSIPAAGMTAKQLEQDVTRRFAAVGLKDPMVSVNIAEYASHLVTVEGAVERPGCTLSSPARAFRRRYLWPLVPSGLPSSVKSLCFAKALKGSSWPSSITQRSGRGPCSIRCLSRVIVW